jgi:hypothetical protein
LAKNLNYSVTKTTNYDDKTTSTTTALFKRDFIIPLMTALLFSLCTKVVAQESNKKEKEFYK